MDQQVYSLHLKYRPRSLSDTDMMTDDASIYLVITSPLTGWTQLHTSRNYKPAKAGNRLWTQDLHKGSIFLVAIILGHFECLQISLVILYVLYCWPTIYTGIWWAFMWQLFITLNWIPQRCGNSVMKRRALLKKRFRAIILQVHIVLTWCTFKQVCTQHITSSGLTAGVSSTDKMSCCALHHYFGE